MSPEMALSDSFQKLWKDSQFRRRLIALVVDEAHCIEEWGVDDFRPLYRKLDTLQSCTRYETPVVSCTATCRTSTFDLIKILHNWRDTACLRPPATPKSQHRARKKARASHQDVEDPLTPRVPPPPQPIFLHEHTTASTSSKYIGSDENVFRTCQTHVPPWFGPLPQVIYATPLPTRSSGLAPSLSHHRTIPAGPSTSSPALPTSPILKPSGPATSSPSALTPINVNPYYHLATPVHYPSQPYPFLYTPSPSQTLPMQYTFKTYNPQSRY